MSSHGTDKLFAGSIPELYDTHLVPLIFEPYAADLAQRLAPRRLARVLVNAPHGVGSVTAHRGQRLWPCARPAP